MKVLEKKETTFKEVCDMLEFEENRFLNGEGNNYSTLEILNRIKNRKNTLFQNYENYLK